MLAILKKVPSKYAAGLTHAHSILVQWERFRGSREYFKYP
jgi:hypothetical protein